MSRPFRAVIATATTAALAAAVAVPALTSADTAAREITVRDKVRAVKIIDVAPKSKREELSQGDRVLTRQAMFDEQDRRVGTLYTDCAATGPTAPLFEGQLQCNSSWSFKDGQIVGEGVIRLGSKPGDLRYPIVGGTGAYRGASGEAAAGPPVKGYDSVDVLRLDG